MSMQQGQYHIASTPSSACGSACACDAAAKTETFATLDGVLDPARWQSPLAGAYRACIQRQLAGRWPGVGACLIEVRVQGGPGCWPCRGG